jgi:hypothetical protein
LRKIRSPSPTPRAIPSRTTNTGASQALSRGLAGIAAAGADPISSTISSRASFTSNMTWMRRSGSFFMHRDTIFSNSGGTLAANVRIGGGS